MGKYIPLLDRLYSKIDVSDDLDACWEWKGYTHKYPYIGIRIEGKTKMYGVHRLVYELCKEPIPDGSLVMHSCDNPRCCNPNHLFVGSNQDNMNDKMKKGRGNQPKGERQWSAVLNPRVVKEIRKDIATGTTYKTLASKYGVSVATIQGIAIRKYWKHVD